MKQVNKMSFESPSRLKPRYASGSNNKNYNHKKNATSSSANSVASTRTYKSHSGKSLSQSLQFHNHPTQEDSGGSPTAADDDFVEEELVQVLDKDNVPIQAKSKENLNKAILTKKEGRPRPTIQQKLRKIKLDSIEVPRLATKPTRIIVPNASIQIPPAIDAMYRDVSAPIYPTDLPVFWHILKSGGTSMKDLFGGCMGKVEASEAGVLDGHINDSTLQQIKFPSGITYVNVDTSTPSGIQRAIEMNLVESGMADMVFTPYLHESSQLFNNTANHKGRAFGLFRHPVERAVSLFHYLKKATWEPTFSERLKKIQSVEDYAISEFAEDNWMVRFLTNKMTTMVTRDDLEVAKEILRRKVIVGLVLDVRGAVERYMHYFGWSFNDLTRDQQKCMNKNLKSGSNKNAHKIVEEGTMGWRILRANNVLDLELYDYVLQLYEEQGQMLKRQKRLKKKKVAPP